MGQFAATQAFDPRSWKGAHDGPPTQVMTIGSTHIGQMKVAVTPDMLAPVLDKLAAFKPDIITHDGLSGEQCDPLNVYSAKYPGMFDDYCWPTDQALKATGLTIPAAMAEIDKSLATWPASPTPAKRRYLAALFVAAGDRPSARMQWLQLLAAEQKDEDGIDEALNKFVTRTGSKPNETYDVTVALAARVGLQRVYAVDDHTADSVQALAGPGLDPFMQELWGRTKSEISQEDDRLEAALKTGVDILTYYRFMSQHSTQREYVTIDYQRAMNTSSPENYGRKYLTWWEILNRRMVSNIRTAFGNQPRARVLKIVGASHKAYYNADLNLTSDVTLIDAEEVLN
jgi:hypothetical protein